ncbi:MAG TPA: protein kinase [Blastocatellia bacterium]|nr:protein kinase [Blastocatellia bacterium]
MVPQEISHYKIIDRIGAGGMGEVFLAEDIRLDRKVAIKMLPAKSIGNDQAKKRLFREAKAAATLDHPNICSIYEVGDEGDCAFIVMQYVEGSTLSRIIKNNVLSPLEVVDIGIQAAQALAEAHSRGVIHRDIKPQNVIITPRGQVKILDFGLAKIIRDDGDSGTGQTESRLTDTGEVVGTVGYMSPEQLRDLPVDARSDIFSLGVLLYECATGKSAFVGSTKIQISLQVIEVNPKRPSECGADIPGELDEVILKSIAKNVEDRYQSANALLADLRKLEAILQGSSLNTRPLTPSPQSRPSTSSAILSGKIKAIPFPLKIGVSLVILATLVTWLGFSIWRGSSAVPSAEARQWYEQGIRDMRAGTYYQASKELEQCIALDNDFAPAHARLAAAYLEIDNTDRAMEELLQALALTPNRSSLSSQDSLYLDAVAATIRREFPKAIDYYRELADKAGESDKASALMDLGRAYERNEQTEKAQENYLAATQKDPNSAAAFLRLAIVYGRRQDAKADGAFDEAQKYYRLMSNQEGMAEAFYQRGALLAKLKKLADAKSSLEEALKLSLNLADNKYQLVKTQLQLSSVYYNEGNTELSKKFATDAIELAQKSRIQNLATNGLIDLGYTLLSRGEFSEARKYFQQALDFAQRDKAASAEARALRAFGSLNQQQGNPAEAISFLERALSFYRPAGYRKEASTVLLLLGRAYRDKGDYETAFNNFNQTLSLATELNDQALMASSHVSIAILRGSEQEIYPEAISHLDESYKINDSLGVKKDMGYDQMNKGSFLWRLGRYQEARTALDLAYSIANRPEASLKTVLAWIHLTNSQVALSQQRFDDAKTKGQEALDAAGTEFRDVALQAKYTIGLATAQLGQAPAARKLCEEAVVMAKELKIPRLESSALLALAEVQLNNNDPAHALLTVRQAQAMFAKAGQQDSEWQAWLLAGRASQRSGNRSDAQACASRADSLCNGLKDKWGNESYESYLRRPDIENYRRQLAVLLVDAK